MEIATSLRIIDYQNVKVTGEANNINNALKEISEIALCKNFSSNRCKYGRACKFQRRNNIEIKDNQQFNGNVNFNIQAKQPNQTIEQQIHGTKVIEYQIIQTLNQKALTEIIQDQ